jgi:hypothetical protein
MLSGESADMLKPREESTKAKPFELRAGSNIRVNPLENGDLDDAASSKLSMISVTT